MDKGCIRGLTMNEYKKKHSKLVMDTYYALPDVDMTNGNVYNSLVATLHEYDDQVGNGEVLNTLKLIIIQLCENCADFIFLSSNAIVGL